MTDLDLDAIEARAHEFCSVCDGSGTVSCWSPGGPCPEGQTVCETCGPCRQSDVPALVAALREARDEVRRLRERAEAHAVTVQQAVAVERQRDDARAEVERLALIVTSLTARVEAKSSWIDGARIDIDGLEGERDDWRRRYEALRDGVLMQVEAWDWSEVTPTIKAIVARVEGDEAQ